MIQPFKHFKARPAVMVWAFPGPGFVERLIRCPIPIKLLEPVPKFPVDQMRLDIFPTVLGGEGKMHLP